MILKGTNPVETQKKTHKLAVAAMLAAIAAVLQFIEFSIPIMPSFVKLDLSDLPALLGAFALGPWWGVLIELAKNLLHLPFGSSAGVGELANFLMGAVFAFTAGIIYKHRKTKKNAMLACLSGAAAMAVMSVVINWFIVYPAYAQMWFGGDMNVIIGMYKTLLPASDTRMKSLLIFNLPFTFAKGIIDAIVTMFIYKPLSNLFVRMNHSLNKNKA